MRSPKCRGRREKAGHIVLSLKDACGASLCGKFGGFFRNISRPGQQGKLGASRKINIDTRNTVARGVRCKAGAFGFFRQSRQRMGPGFWRSRVRGMELIPVPFGFRLCKLGKRRQNHSGSCSVACFVRLHTRLLKKPFRRQKANRQTALFCRTEAFTRNIPSSRSGAALLCSTAVPAKQAAASFAARVVENQYE